MTAQQFVQKYRLVVRDQLVCDNTIMENKADQVLSIKGISYSTRFIINFREFIRNFLFNSIAVMRLSRPLFTQYDPHHLESFYLADTGPLPGIANFSLAHEDHDLDMVFSSRYGLLLPQSFGLESMPTVNST